MVDSSSCLFMCAWKFLMDFTSVESCNFSVEQFSDGISVVVMWNNDEIDRRDKRLRKFLSEGKTVISPCCSGNISHRIIIRLLSSKSLHQRRLWAATMREFLDATNIGLVIEGLWNKNSRLRWWDCKIMIMFRNKAFV